MSAKKQASLNTHVAAADVQCVQKQQKHLSLLHVLINLQKGRSSGGSGALPVKALRRMLARLWHAGNELSAMKR